MYKSSDIVINKDGDVSVICEIIKQNSKIIEYVDNKEDIIAVDLDFIEPAIYKYNQLLNEAQKDLKRYETVQLKSEKGYWYESGSVFKFWETLDSCFANNHIVLKCNMTTNNEFLAVKDVRRYNKELVELERSMGK